MKLENGQEKVKKMYVVINAGYGGFSVSDELKDEYHSYIDEIREGGTLDKEYLEWMSQVIYELHSRRTDDVKYRSDPHFVHLVQKMGGERASGMSAKLKIVEVPNDAINPYIGNYDGHEWVAEGRTWYAEVDLEDE